MKNTIRVAIADDHSLVRSGIALILNAKEDIAVVQQSSNGKELLDGLKANRPDVILLDIEMPVLSGPDTLVEIRKTEPNIPVLILTMHQNEAFIIKMMELGANGYLLKDTKPDEVTTAIYKVVESKFYFSELVSTALLNKVSNPSLDTDVRVGSHELTSREVDVLRLICKEHTTSEIGEKLFLSPKTIEGYRKILMEKTGSRNMAGLVLYSIKHGIIIDI